MKYKIGVFGSGANNLSGTATARAAQKIGIALGEQANKVIVITGGCTGLPYEAASEAAKSGVEVWGFSPVFDLEQQKLFAPDDDPSIYSKLHFVPKDVPFADNQRICMKYRNVLSTAACDAGIIISGRWGSLNEFTNLIDMQKTVGVLTGSGGIADELPMLAKKISKAGQGEIIFESDPVALVQKVLEALERQSSTS